MFFTFLMNATEAPKVEISGYNVYYSSNTKGEHAEKATPLMQKLYTAFNSSALTPMMLNNQGTMANFNAKLTNVLSQLKPGTRAMIFTGPASDQANFQTVLTEAQIMPNMPILLAPDNDGIGIVVAIFTDQQAQTIFRSQAHKELMTQAIANGTIANRFFVTISPKV